MTTFNKILTPVYSTISGFSLNPDGSMNATYALGTGTEDEGAVSEFTPLVSEYKYIDSQQAAEIMATPFTKDDIGKSPTQIIQDRIYAFLKNKGEIVA